MAIVYLFSFLAFYGQYALLPQVYAQSGGTEKVDLVAIFVDEEIYADIQQGLSWYANVYIPQQSPGSKTLIFPIQPDGFHAKDIQQILQNLYYDGEKDTPSKLA